MKLRIQIYALIGLTVFVAGFLWLYYATRSEEDIAIFPATINRDCAPWDGTAFTVSIPYNSGSTITISIWQSPSFRFPVSFSFPDETGRVGFAYILPPLDPLEQLTGKVTFWRVEQGIPVEGEFDLTSDGGGQFKGRFKAEWGEFIAMCG